ncbi:YetF domain-containing protein [Rossellomorea oryzaecorticis]|uniref:YetF domain-containing protein n=1 Tax=Rossellomorea oryzaecorticis TaxID=1396505 RepID=A0ABU9KC70_9BACI
MEWKDILFKAEELNYIELFLRTTILYFVLFLADKSLGFRQPGILTPYNFLVGAGISHIAASRMVQPESRPIDAIAIITVYIIIILLLSYSYLKFSPYFASKRQTVIVEKGKVNKKNMKKTLLTIDNMLSILRQKDAFDLENVEYMIAEPNGDFSVAKNRNGLPVTKAAMQVPMTTKQLSDIVIYEGRIDKNILKKRKLDVNWIMAELDRQNISGLEKVYIGLLTTTGELYIN